MEKIKQISRRRLIYDLTQVMGLDETIVSEINILGQTYQLSQTQESKIECDNYAHLQIRILAPVEELNKYLGIYEKLKRLK